MKNISIFTPRVCPKKLFKMHNRNIFIERLEFYRGITFFQLFTIYTRYLIGSAFVIAAIAMGKLSGDVMPLATDPNAPPDSAGHLFNSFSHSGLYWRFIGWTQVLSGLLLMTQRFAKLGALIFYPLIINIYLITVSYGFAGTPYITGLMTLAATYLLVWDFNSLKYIFSRPKATNFVESGVLPVAEHGYWIILGFIIFLTIPSCFFLKINIFIVMLICLAEGLIALPVFFLIRKMKKQNN